MLMAPQYTETVFNGNTSAAVPRIFQCGHNIPMGYLDRIAVIRKRKKLTQAGLAEKLGVEQPTVQRWEKGAREPEFGQLFALANVLGVRVGDLFSDAPDGGPEWEPRPDTLGVILEVALLPFPGARVSADDLPIFAHAVTEAVKYVATDPARADRTGFRDAVEAIVETAVRNYKPANGQAA